ncbi:hypothetical protein LOZ58_006387 [Ophidiomyces ophidiicola]|nr:hypothetical protein LOZ58_006387 [Ophidiomyces ophidiicola]
MRRSPTSCRLHYQNYLERRAEWDEKKKTKLARLYKRLKGEMWAKVAEDMQMPFRAVEAMHWHLGQDDMARRAGVQPFTPALSACPPPEGQAVVYDSDRLGYRDQTTIGGTYTQLPVDWNGGDGLT